MSGTNQVTFTDKVNTRTLPIPTINKVRDVDMNELKGKHNALDSEMTDPTTGLKKKVEDIESEITPPNIVSKLASIPDEEDKLQTESVGFFNSNVVSLINANVPEISPSDEQFSVTASPDNQLFLKNTYIQTSGLDIYFDAWRRYGTAKAPLNGNLTQNIIGALIGTRQLIFHKSVLIPTFPSTWIITDGTYSTEVTDINIIVVDYYEDDLQTVKIISVPYGETPIINGIILHLEFEEVPTPANLRDSSGNFLVVNVLEQAQGTTSQPGPVGNSIGFGNIAQNNDGTYAEVVSEAITETVTTEFTVAFWGAVPSGVVLGANTWFSSDQDYTINGIRIKHISDGRMEIYLNNIGAENTVNRLRLQGINVAPDGIFHHWMFIYANTNLTIYYDNV